MPVMSIGRALSWWADQDPEFPAVVCGRVTVTRAELDRRSTDAAASLIRQGVCVDDVVAVGLGNGVEFVVACAAAWKAGATVLPLPPRLLPGERAALLALAAPALIVEAPLRADPSAGDPLPDLAASCWKVATSSGSTGSPKLVRASAAALVDPHSRVAPFVPPSATQLVAAPLTGSASFTYAMRGLMTGHSLVIMEHFDAEEWLALVEQHRVTWAVLAPSTMRQILDSPTRVERDVSSLTSILHVGARCSSRVKRGFIDWLGPERVVEVYAGTESQGIACIDGVDWLARPGSVGRGVGGTEFGVVRPDGSPCRPGEIGEILMRRDGSTYTYVGAEAVVRDGWHTLGDQGWLDEDGFLFVADRTADVVMTPRGPAYPADVEEVLEAVPGVREAVVVGCSDGTLHAVLDTAGVDASRQVSHACAALSEHERPVSFTFRDRSLRDAAGKVRRRALKQQVGC